jgi:hypothetical protein
MSITGSLEATLRREFGLKKEIPCTSGRVFVQNWSKLAFSCPIPVLVRPVLVWVSFIVSSSRVDVASKFADT